MTTNNPTLNQEAVQTYLNDLNPIPITGETPALDSLTDWARRILPWLERGDDLADAAIHELRKHPGALGQAVDTTLRLADEGVPACRALIDDMQQVPAWVDFDLMRQGGKMAQRHFPLLVLALIYGGLPLTFAHPDAAAVFASTARMENDIGRRMNESATLFFGVTNSDELAPGRSMWRACLQVRLVHAMVRVHLLSKGWDTAEQGLPINQLATSAGPAFFGTHLLGSLTRLGAQPTEEEALGHKMIWRYTTRLLGVPEELIGATQAEQDEYDRHITSVIFAPDDRARAVMAGLIDGLANQKPTSSFPGDLQLALFRRMLGDAMADAFAVPIDSKGEKKLARLLPLFRLYGRLQSNRLVASPLQRLGRRVLSRLGTEGLISLDRAGSRH